MTGEVTGKRQEHGNELVDVAVRFTNQRGEDDGPPPCTGRGLIEHLPFRPAKRLWSGRRAG